MVIDDSTTSLIVLGRQRAAGEAVSAAPPDLGALYIRHRDAMHKVAASVLREAGLASQAGDAVNDAIVSIMASPPNDVRNWEAFLVTAAKRKALDRIRSAEVRHAGPELDESLHDQIGNIDIADGVAADVDRKRSAAVAWDCLSILDGNHRKVIRDIAALERSRDEVAAELGVSPSRISQMTTKALAKLDQAKPEF